MSSWWSRCFGTTEPPHQELRPLIAEEFVQWRGHFWTSVCSPLSNLSDRVQSAFRRTKLWWDRYTDIFASYTVLGISSTILASFYSDEIPPTVVNSSYLLLSFVGLSWVNYQAGYVEKYRRDTHLAWRTRSKPIGAYTAGQMAETLVNIGLTISGSVASLFFLAEKPEKGFSIYTHSRPVAMAALVGFNVLVIANHSLNRRAAHRLKHAEGLDAQEKRDLFEIIARPEEAPLPSSSIIHDATLVRALVDKDTLRKYTLDWAGLSAEKKQERMEAILHILHENIQTQQAFTKRTLALVLAGDVMLIFSEYNQRTVLQAWLWVISSASYALVRTVKKCREAGQRNALTALVAEPACSAAGVGRDGVAAFLLTASPSPLDDEALPT